MGLEFKSILVWPCLVAAGIGVFSPDMTNEMQSTGLVGGSSTQAEVVFATYAESNEQLQHVFCLAESIREFSGRFSTCPIWLYMPGSFADPDTALIQRLQNLGVYVRGSTIPEQASWFYFAGKVYASALAEKAAEQQGLILIWLDDDTVILREPDAFALPDSVSLAYRPVMHNRSGTLYGEEPNAFWSRIYKVLHVRDEQLFPMTTPADRQVINAYFNAGLLVVRPERGILRGWAEAFSELCRDGELAAMCRDDVTYRIFLHQTALVGAVLHRLTSDEMVELSEDYNYPIFFKKMYGATQEFDSVEGIVTLRYDVYFRNPDPRWADQLTGPEDLLTWLRHRLGAEPH